MVLGRYLIVGYLDPQGEYDAITLVLIEAFLAAVERTWILCKDFCKAQNKTPVQKNV